MAEQFGGAASERALDEKQAPGGVTHCRPLSKYTDQSRSIGDRHAHVADADRVAARHSDIARCRAPGLLQPRSDQPGRAGRTAGVVRAGLMRRLAVQLGGEARQRFGGEVLDASVKLRVRVRGWISAEPAGRLS